jgi:hypothetical protein
MPCVVLDSLWQEHWTGLQDFRASIYDLVVLVDNSAADSDFTLAHRHIKNARWNCATARDAAPEHHQKEHGC